MLVALAAVVGLAAVGAVTAPPVHAQEAQVSLAVQSDGAAPFDALDPTAGNGVVRTRDVLTYAWNYASASVAAGAVTFTQTLTAPPAIVFDASNVRQCTGPGGGVISGGGQTLRCSVAVDPTGVGTVPITVTVPGTIPNGTVIGSTMSAADAAAPGAPLAGGSTTTTVVGRPQLNLQANLYGTPTAASVNGAAGNGYVYTFAVTQPAGAKGTELVTAPLTFTADLSTISPNAVLVPDSCGPNNRGGSALPYGAVGISAGATAANAVTRSGTVSCSVTGRVVTVTITGADLTGAASPTTGAQGNTLDASLTHLVSGVLTVFVPGTDITGAKLDTTLQYRGFDPTSISGQSNFGSGYEPGGEPSAAACGFVANNLTRSNDNCHSASFTPRAAGWGSYFVVADTSLSAAPAGAATTGTSGNGVLSPGERFYDRTTIYSTSGTALSNPAVCDKWNPDELRLVGLGRSWKGAALLSSADVTVEYAVLPMATDAARRSTSCSTGTWYPTVDAAGGAGVVNAVRFTYNGTVANGEFVLNFPQFEVRPVPVGTIVATFSSGRLGGTENWSPSYYVRETNSPNYTGNRATVSDGRLRVTQSTDLGANPSVLAGGTVGHRLQPVVSRNTAATSTIGGVTVTATLPHCARYVPDSASVPVELLAAKTGADGIPCTNDTGETGPTLVFKLGSVTPNAAIPAITYRASMLQVTLDNTTAPTAVVISSDAAVAVDLAARTSTASVTVRNQTQFAIAQTTTTPQISGNGAVEFAVVWRNLSGLTVPRLVAVTELPYNGDPAGSTFRGTLTWAGASAPPGTSVECTTAAHGTIPRDPSAGTVTWSSTCGPSTTAVRLTVTDLANAAIDRVAVRLTADGPASGDRYVSTAVAAYTPSGSSTPVTLTAGAPAQAIVVQSTVGGRVWNDVDGNGLRQAAESAAAGVPVALTGTDDLGAAVARSAVTGSDGTYSFTGLRAGTYAVTFAGGTPPAGAAFSPRQVGSDRSIDSDADPATGRTAAVTVGPGAVVAGLDQGLAYGAPPVTLGRVPAVVALGDPVTLTATVPNGVTGTVTFTDGVVSGPDAGTRLTLGTATITAGVATWTGVLPAFGVNAVIAAYGGNATYPASASPAVPVEVTGVAGAVVVSEFRLSGPGGPADDYVQLRNVAAVAVPLAGLVVQAADGSPVTLPATAPTLAPGRSYLVAGSGYSLAAVVAADLTVPGPLGIGDAGGVRVTFPDTAGTVADAVGSADGYRTGTALPALTGTPTAQFAWVRQAQTGPVQNTRDNRADFVLVSTGGGPVGGVPSVVGAPSPRASGSPVDLSGLLPSRLLDPSGPPAAAPNRVVVAGAPGTLTVRRVVTNETGRTLTSLRLRTVSLSAADGPARPGVSVPTRAAWLRLVAPATPTSTVTVGGRDVVVQNLTPDPPAVGGVGGLNSTATVPLPAGGLAPGASVAVAFTFAVDRTGTFWFQYVPES